MTGRDSDDRLLDDLLASHYAQVRASNDAQREQVAARVAAAQADIAPARRAIHRLSLALLATAACLLVTLGLGIMLISPTADHAYGIETVRERFFEVQTIAIRGTDYIYDNHDPKAPAVKIPTEFLVKRPDKYRHTHIGVGQSQKGVEIRRFMRYCDGRHETVVMLDKKEYATGPTSPLDAQIKVEQRVQMKVASDLLSPSEEYKRLRSEIYRGRRCDVYENRVRDGALEMTMIETLWFDPMTGLPVRLAFDEVLEDGTVRRESEYDEIAVNMPLEDALFAFTPPTDFRSLMPPGEEKDEPGSRAVPPLDISCTGGGSGNGSTFESWHAFRISDRTMLAVWRRSEPEAAKDGSRDWLSNLEITTRDPDRAPPQHTWFYQSGSPDKWNWSLLSTTDGPLSDRFGSVTFKLTGPNFEGTDGMLPLRFSDADLEKILAAAGEAMLPTEAPPHTLEALRKFAREQLKVPPAR